MLCGHVPLAVVRGAFRSCLKLYVSADWGMRPAARWWRDGRHPCCSLCTDMDTLLRACLTGEGMNLLADTVSSPAVVVPTAVAASGSAVQGCNCPHHCDCSQQQA